MLRDVFKKNIGMNKEFRFRGAEPGRLENFSDAVFALAITLLLISTTPPSTFQQIRRFTFDLIPFVMCIALIILIWHEHFVFYYRYGMRNGKVVFLNTLFLVIVLFYVYPLKFLTKLSLFAISVPFKIQWLTEELMAATKGGHMADLMIIYGFGAASVFFVLRLMYKYALGKAEELELNEIELFDTRTSVTTNLLMGVIPLLSVSIAIIFYNSVWAGLISGVTYFLYWPVMLIHGLRVNKKREELLKSLEQKDQTESE